MIIAMLGLPASGKTAIARCLANKTKAYILDKDVVRATLLRAEDIEYSTQQDDFIMTLIYQLAAHLFSRDPGRLIIIDGRTFSRNYQRAHLFELAKQTNNALKLIECVCSEESARKRLEQDVLEQKHLARNRGVSLYQQLKSSWEEVEEEHLLLDTDLHSLEECVNIAYNYIFEQ